MSETLIDLTVSFRGQSHHLSLPPTSTLSDLSTELESLTAVPPSHQKLLYKGKKPNAAPECTLADAGLRSGAKVQLLGPTPGELGGMHAVEDEQRRRERIMRERALKAPAKVRSTGPASSSSLSSLASTNYTFHRIEPLQHLPAPSEARELLTRLANDPAIAHVMRTHRFSVGLLTELAPHEQPHLLGLNMNAGQAIKLRLRTDQYDGFRLYKDVRRVLCHELTHNVWGDHDDSFKKLNSQLNREVAEFERAAAAGTHHLTSAEGGQYEPGSELDAEADAYLIGCGPQVLGGPGALTAADDSREERRRRVLEATMSRLRKEEEELEQRCGTDTSHPQTGR